MAKFALLFLFLFASGILAALFISPVSAVLVYQLVYFVNPDNSWWAASIPGLQYSFIAALLMLFMLTIRYKELSDQAQWKNQPVLKWMVAILFVYIFMINFAVVAGVHKSFTYEFAKLVIIIFAAYKLITSERALNACLWAYIAGVTYIGYIAYSVGRDGQGRVEGIGMIDTGGDGNMTAAAMVPALIILTYMAWMGNKKVKLLAIFCGGFIANGIVLINSRGAFLGAVVGTLFFLMYMIFSKYQRKGQKGTAILIILIGLAGTIYVTDEAFWSRMETLQDIDDGGKSGSHRVDFWMATFDVLQDYPLGVGIQGFIELSPNYLPERYFEGRKVGKATHSTWFQALSEIGWIGFLCLLALLISTFKISRKTKQHLINVENYDAYFKVLALEGALISFLVAASFIDRARSEMLYWLILFIAVASNIYYIRFSELGNRKRKPPMVVDTRRL
ncbi:O-antigen ligase family protein [Marinobacter sp. F3R11]|uniref:O-antigen ligase family protein n=1 Tax=Marinobacter sp. F3R11 TaxID=2267231 RepID=UPI000DE97447|nr:O-antigen ligase family protein [Marinobacter sp. F3R11]RBW49727.1 O-antigen ligase domain-containing protein [Marinobacter sp. F3R11]